MPLSRDELIRRYSALSAATVYDVLDKLGHPGQALSSDIRPLTNRLENRWPGTDRSRQEHDGRRWPLGDGVQLRHVSGDSAG